MSSRTPPHPTLAPSCVFSDILPPTMAPRHFVSLLLRRRARLRASASRSASKSRCVRPGVKPKAPKGSAMRKGMFSQYVRTRITLSAKDFSSRVASPAERRGSSWCSASHFFQSLYTAIVVRSVSRARERSSHVEPIAVSWRPRADSLPNGLPVVPLLLLPTRSASSARTCAKMPPA